MWGGIDNIEIKSTEDLFRDSSVDAVIVATMYFRDTVKVLKERGFEGTVYSAHHMLRFEETARLRHDLLDIHSLLCDKRSIEVVDFIYSHRISRNISYIDVCEPNQYFVKDIMKVNPHAVFVDAGAYHGETIDDFVEFNNGEFDKVYAFEMCSDNYDILKQRKFDEKVEILNYGLWDEKVICSYSADEGCSTIGVGELSTRCITLDEVVGDGNVTFIKMDIEGAEMKALLGAEKCIKRCKPQLAICVYHKPNDMYDLTTLIHEWLPEHKLYIRHHSSEWAETVLYAVG